MSKPTFSVLISAYQAAPYIRQAIESVISQTLSPSKVQVIVIDDGSTDETRSILETFQGCITILANDENKGAAASHNRGLRKAAGEWIVLLDADDYWDNRRLERVADTLRFAGARTVVTTDAYVVDSSGKTKYRYYDRQSFPTRNQDQIILSRNFVFGSAAFPREPALRLGGFDEQLGPYDWDLWVRFALMDGWKFHLVREPLAYYRQHAGNVSRDSKRTVRDSIRIMNKVLARNDLTVDQREIASDTRALYRHRLEAVSPLELRTALLTDDPKVRKLAWSATRDFDLTPKVRLKAALAALFPRLAKKVASSE